MITFPAAFLPNEVVWGLKRSLTTQSLAYYM